MATKKTAAPATPRFRVLRAFRHDGVYYSNDNRGQVAELPPAVLEDRVARGYLEARQPASHDPAPAATAKE